MKGGDAIFLKEFIEVKLLCIAGRTGLLQTSPEECC